MLLQQGACKACNFWSDKDLIQFISESKWWDKEDTEESCMIWDVVSKVQNEKA